MNNLNVKKITIEADSKEEAIAELRKQLGGEVPAEVLDSIVSRMFSGETEGVAEVNEAPEPTKGDQIAELRSLVHEAAEEIAGMPADQQHKAMEDLVVMMGQSLGFTREEALSKANETKARVNHLLENVLGVKIPESLRRQFGDTPKPGVDKPAQEPKQDRRQRVSDNFDKAYAALHAAGYSKQAICHIGQHYKHQEAAVDFMGHLFRLGRYDGDHRHLPSAKLFQQLDDYLVHTNEMVYSMCKRAGADPEAFGFNSEAQWRKDNRSVNDCREAIQKTIDAAAERSARV